MAYTISAYGCRWSTNEDELTTLTRDEVFDMLEDFEDRFRDKQKDLAYIRAKATDAETRYKYDRVKNALDALDAYWESIRNSPIEEFYINSFRKKQLEKEDNIIWAFFNLLDEILYKGTVTLRNCDIEITLNGAKLKVEEHTDDTPYYICFRHTNGADKYTYDTCREYDDAVREVSELNRNNRFFKCKECGKITYISKADDERKKAHGLQPVQRCKDCVQKRKAEKQAVQKSEVSDELIHLKTQKVSNYLSDFSKHITTQDYSSSVKVRDITISVNTERTDNGVPYLKGVITNGKDWTRSFVENYDLGGFTNVCTLLDYAWKSYKSRAIFSTLFD